MDKTTLSLFLLSFLLLLAGCAPTMSAQVLVTIPNIDHMVVATIGEPYTVDPAWAYDSASAELIFNVYETLIRFNFEKVDEFVPCLATEWAVEDISEVSPEGLTWVQRYTFKVREGVKFQDGSLLTTEDVEYSFERWMVQDRHGGPAWLVYKPLLGVWRANLSDPEFHLKIDDAVQHNATHVWFNLIMLYTPFLQILSQSWSSIVNKEFCIAHGDWPGTWENWQDYHNPDVSPLDTDGDWMCGTGPYKLDYWTHGNGFGGEYSLIKFDDHWQGWPAPECSRFVSRATLKFMLPWPVKKKMLLNRTADIIYVPREHAEELEGVLGIRCIKSLPILGSIAVFFNFNISTASSYIGSGMLDGNGIPPSFFSDIDVRKGFAYSINYTQYIEEVYLGEATQPATPVIEGLPYHNPEQEKHSFNLTRAEQHFRAAWSGQLWDIGFNITIPYYMHNCGAKGGELPRMLKTNIESVNPKFHIDTLGTNWPDFIEQLLHFELPVFLMSWLADCPDPHNFVYPFMHSNGDYAYFQSYSNATVDALVEEGLRTMYTTKRREIYYELQAIYHDQCPSVPAAQPLCRHWERDWVQGWYYNPAYPGLYFYHLWKGLDADVTGDDYVDISDAGKISAHWYSPPFPTGPLGYHRKADIYPVSELDGADYMIPGADGKVNILDAALINAQWHDQAVGV